MRCIQEYHGLKFGTDIHLHVTTQLPLDIKQQSCTYNTMAGYRMSLCGISQVQQTNTNANSHGHTHISEVCIQARMSCTCVP